MTSRDLERIKITIKDIASHVADITIYDFDEPILPKLFTSNFAFLNIKAKRYIRYGFRLYYNDKFIDRKMCMKDIIIIDDLYEFDIVADNF